MPGPDSLYVNFYLKRKKNVNKCQTLVDDKLAEVSGEVHTRLQLTFKCIKNNKLGCRVAGGGDGLRCVMQRVEENASVASSWWGAAVTVKLLSFSVCSNILVIKCWGKISCKMNT